MVGFAKEQRQLYKCALVPKSYARVPHANPLSYGVKWLSGLQEGVRLPKRLSELGINKSAKDHVSTHDYREAVLRLANDVSADLGFVVGSLSAEFANAESALKDNIGTAVPRLFLQRLSKQRAAALTMGLQSHAEAAFQKVANVEYYITSLDMFERLRQRYLAGELTDETLFPMVEEALDHTIFELKEGVGHAQAELTCDVLASPKSDVVVGLVTPVALTLKYDQPPTYEELHCQKASGLPLGWDRVACADGRTVFLVSPSQPVAERQPVFCGDKWLEARYITCKAAYLWLLFFARCSWFISDWGPALCASRCIILLLFLSISQPPFLLGLPSSIPFAWNSLPSFFSFHYLSPLQTFRTTTTTAHTGYLRRRYNK